MSLAIRIARISVVVLLIVAIASVLVFLRLWQDRPSIGLMGWSEATIVAEPTDMVTVTWLGTTTLLFDDRETQILIDGNFTRVNLLKIGLFLPISSDVATINYALTEFGMMEDRLAAIVPVHSHFDHAMDVGHVANRTRAVILGSESTANIARGADVPVHQYQILADGETRQFGDFTIRLLASRHAPIKSGDEAWFPGTIDTELQQPASVDAWKEGVVWSVFIGHPRGTTLIQGSGGIVEGKLQDETADVVMLGIAGLAGLGKDYVEQLWHETVRATGARRVIAVHHDDFTAPFGEVRLLPHIADNILFTAGWINEVNTGNDSQVTIELPPFGQQIPLY